jgi:S1-C subfamily serine protease
MENQPMARLLFLLCSIAVILQSSPAVAQVLKITSKPSGAKVEIDGVLVGSTPYEVKLPGGYFHKTHTVFNARLEHAMVLRVSLDGYTSREILMTEGPMRWKALNGTDHGEYWLLKTDHFDCELELMGKSFTGTVVATAAGNSKVEMRAELPMEDLVEKSKPAVVSLAASGRLGSGFLVSDTGLIVTNAHVVRGSISATASLSTGQKLEAKVIYIDPEVDIALVKVEGSGFPHLALTDTENVRQGQTVLAIGSPLGLSFSATKGIVSGVRNLEPAEHGTWIQTDAAINPGNSGGPLINTYGEVVGVNTLKMVENNAQNIGFALSSSNILTLLQRFYPDISRPTQTSAPLKNQVAEGFGSISISSVPDSAEVFVDGKFVGNAPETLKLSVGPHKIQLKVEGRKDWERSVEILKDSQLNLKGQLPIVN